MSKNKLPLITPGEILKEEFLDEMNVKPGTLARKIGVDRSAINKIIQGKRAITAEMALRFSLFFGTSAELWLNLQKDYELRQARRERLMDFEDMIEPYKAATGAQDTVHA